MRTKQTHEGGKRKQVATEAVDRATETNKVKARTNIGESNAVPLESVRPKLRSRTRSPRSDDALSAQQARNHQPTNSEPSHQTERQDVRDGTHLKRNATLDSLDRYNDLHRFG
ncbi:uncharacterized protein J3R85_011412 [Psidium guajava]|nr:uncharacterized protein J3R85_011412 [Psidium guajava]